MYPDDIKYTKTHEWVKAEGKIATVGITDYAAKELSDIVFIELPKAGKRIEKGSPMGAIESVKAVSEIYSPLSGEIVDANKNVVEIPEGITQDPYGKGWFLRIKMDDPHQMDGLLSAEAYKAIIEQKK